MNSTAWHRLAELELIDAAGFYEAERAGLGAAFLVEVESTVLRLARRPGMGLRLPSGLQRFLVRRFPFAVIYAVDAEILRVLAVAHLKRRPDYWRDRVES